MAAHMVHDPRSIVRIADRARDLIYQHVYKALRHGDEEAVRAMTAFARVMPYMKFESLEEAAQIARGWAECAEWSTKRLKRKGTLTTSQERANLVAIGALVWVGEILSPTS